MAGQAPKSRFTKFPATGVLNEWRNPADVGGSGLTDCNNLMYHRSNSWGKRPGNSEIGLPALNKDSPCSGFRWYRAFPTPLTNIVLYASSHLLTGKNVRNLTDQGIYNLNGSQTAGQGPSFCSARDPQSNGGNGADTIIVAGLKLPKGSFGIGDITITGAPGSQPTSGSQISVTVTNNALNSVTTMNYQILGSDTPASICAGLAQLLNQTAAFLNQGSFTPYIGESYFTVANQNQPVNAGFPNAICHLGAQLGGVAGNLITYGVTWTYADQAGGTTGTLAVVIGITGQGGGQINVPHDSALHQTNMVEGGNEWDGPLRCDLLSSDVDFIGLSYMCPNAFTDCVSWHQHVWFWGDPQNPDTLFACDINQPEAFTFMIENGGMQQNPQGQTGGYTIGAGDGDPGIQTVVPLGNALYVFKTNNVYMIQGYDFQPGEYQFSITPQVVGYGVPSPNCVAVLENQLVFWSGRKFLRLAVGAYEPEHIGLPIPITEGLASNGNQFLVQAVAGDFQVQTQMNDVYAGKGPGEDTPVSTTILLKSQALFAVDIGSGNADHIIVFDDEMTELKGEYCWTKWTFPEPVGFWILYGQGPNPEGTNADAPLLWWMNAEGTDIHQFGGNAFGDGGLGSPKSEIPWLAQTGWVDFSSAELLKNQHRLFINANASDSASPDQDEPNGAVFNVKLIPGQQIPASGQDSPYSTTPVTISYPPTIAPEGGEALNELEQYIEPALQSKSVLLQITEDGTSFTGFEVLSWAIDINPEEAFSP